MMNLLKSLIAMSSITMLSRILGFIRDVIIAKMFGAGMMTDIFVVAFKIPNLLRRIFAEGAFYQVFLPILSEYQCHANNKELRAFVARVFGLLIIILVFIILVALLLAPWVIMIIAPGFDNSAEKFAMTVKIFRIIFPYILLISLTSLMGAILNVWNFFLVPACTPIFLNISMIVFLLFSESLCCDIPISGLAWSVIFGGIFQCIYYFPFLKNIDMLVVPKISFRDSRIFKICRSMGPALVAASSMQISLIINNVLASFLKDGSISWIYYADRLIELPIGVFGVTLSTILLSYLSRCVFDQNHRDYLNVINWGIKVCCVLSFPSAVILGMLSKPLIITIFQYGKFSEFDVLMTQYSLIVYAIGLPGLILVKVLTSGFYARRDLKTPVKIVIITVIFSQFLNLMCITLLQHVVFAFSISMSAWLNAGLLYWNLKKKYFLQLPCRYVWFVCRILIGVFIVYFVCLGVLELVADWTDGSVLYRLLRMIGILIICGSSYFITLWCLGLRLRNFFYYSKDSHNN